MAVRALRNRRFSPQAYCLRRAIKTNSVFKINTQCVHEVLSPPPPGTGAHVYGHTIESFISIVHIIRLSRRRPRSRYDKIPPNRKGETLKRIRNPRLFEYEHVVFLILKTNAAHIRHSNSNSVKEKKSKSRLRHMPVADMCVHSPTPFEIPKETGGRFRCVWIILEPNLTFNGMNLMSRYTVGWIPDKSRRNTLKI